MKKLTVDRASYASNQGVVQVSRAEYVRYCGSNFLIRWYLYANSLLPVSLRFGFVRGGFRWRRFAEHFHLGDLNAVIVLDPQRGLVAAYTDLDARLQKRFPVINIFREKLHLLPQPPKVGDRFVAASLYGSDPYAKKEQRWGSFYPIVVNCVVRDQTKCDFAKAKISDAEWKALEIGLSQISDKTCVGLHHIVLPAELKASL